MMKNYKYFLLMFFFFTSTHCIAQSVDSLSAEVQNIPDKFYSKVENKYSSIDKNLSKKSIKYLKKLQKQENKISSKLSLLDSTNNVTNKDVNDKYNGFIESLKEKDKNLENIKLNQYNPYIDSLSTSLSFLKKFTNVLGKTNLPLESLDQLKQKFNQSEKINDFIAQRKQQIQQLLSGYTKVPASLKRQFDRLNKTAYYYKAQVNEYKSVLKDPKMIEEKALKVLNKIPAFQKFMQKNSEIGSLFGVPGDIGALTNVSGLQTRVSVQNLVKQQIASGGPNALAEVKQNLAAAGKEIDKIKNKLNPDGGGNGDTGMPTFKPNDQKTKPFLKRLEYGFNVQFSKTNQWVPSSANLALTLGYKINNKSTAGVGMSYNMGLGSLQHIRVSSQGLGLRSYLDWKIRKQIYASGGYEMNYNSAFKSIEQLKNENAWQRSGLIGISKKYKVSKKLSGNIQLLYDFLARTHTPVSQPFLFRMGYNF